MFYLKFVGSVVDTVIKCFFSYFLFFIKANFHCFWLPFCVFQAFLLNNYMLHFMFSIYLLILWDFNIFFSTFCLCIILFEILIKNLYFMGTICKSKLFLKCHFFPIPFKKHWLFEIFVFQGNVALYNFDEIRD